MRPYDVKTEADLLSMRSDNHPQETSAWTILNLADEVSLFPPSGVPGPSWVTIPRAQFNAIVDWYMKDQGQ
ncbi:MAG TPA: hypothetical protein VGO04_12640 [Ensifer sp.]|jgi:hypothetical protein|uniref:hypothetical protein n=1 Tax=Ensifer sp. TaxID=1872086 RepID=UPI002E1601A1|nr:hypothetical protein [Ensifer sp.]